MDMTINVKLGKRTLEIPFTGGITSKNGVIPASYSTNNSIVQFAIEHSVHYKNGLVKLIKQVGKAEPKCASLGELAAANLQSEQKTIVEEQPQENDATIATENADEDGNEEQPQDEAADEAAASDGSEDDATGTSSADEVTVSCIDDARDYLTSHFDIAPSKLRYKRNILDYAAEHGVTFIGLEE